MLGRYPKQNETEAFKENVEQTVETQILPQPTSPAPIQVIAPVPVLAPIPVESPVATSADFKRVKGIGMKRASQLEALGISNLEELAKASAEELATELQISPKITKMWIGQAKKLIK